MPRESSETMHECGWCLHDRPCLPIGGMEHGSGLWICGDCEADTFMFHAATGGDLEPRRRPSGQEDAND